MVVTAPATVAPPAVVVAPPPPSSSASAGQQLLRTLQQENDGLRYQLLQTERERDRQSRQLDVASEQLVALREQLREQQRAAAINTTAAAAATHVSAISGDSTTTSVEVQRLQGRCEALAQRLLAAVRDRQLSESTETFFFLRTQQEERRYLCEALEAVVADLGVESVEARRARQRAMYGANSSSNKADNSDNSNGVGGDTTAIASGGLHAGTVSELVLLVADAVASREAHAKIETARARLSLEAAAALLAELQEMTERVARAVYGTSSALMDTLELTYGEEEGQEDGEGDGYGYSGGGGVGSFLDRSYGAVRQQQQQHRGGSTAGDSPLPLPSRLTTARHSASRLSATADGAVGGLEWACDVLRACVKGIAAARARVGEAAAVMSLPPDQHQQHQQHQYQYFLNGGIDHRTGSALVAVPDGGGVSHETERLILSLARDLQAASARAAADRAALTRRLAAELQRHRETAQQYEARVRQLEAEAAAATAALVKADQQLQQQQQRSAPVPVAVTAVVAPQAATAATTPAATTARGADRPSSRYLSSRSQRSVTTTPERYSPRRDSVDDDEGGTYSGRGGDGGGGQALPLPAFARPRTVPAQGPSSTRNARALRPYDYRNPDVVAVTSPRPQEQEQHRPRQQQQPVVRERPVVARIMSPAPRRGSDKENNSANTINGNHSGNNEDRVARTDPTAGPRSGLPAAASAALQPRRPLSKATAPPARSSPTTSTSSSLEVPSPPPRPVSTASAASYGQHQTMAGAALAERRQQQQQRSDYHRWESPADDSDGGSIARESTARPGDDGEDGGGDRTPDRRHRLRRKLYVISPVREGGAALSAFHTTTAAHRAVPSRQ